MFICTIELLSTLNLAASEPTYWKVAEFKFDPGCQIEDELWINWEVWGKNYRLKTKVLQRQKEVISPNPNLRKQYGDDAADKGLFRLRIFVEAEDRDAVLELSEAIKKNNP